MTTRVVLAGQAEARFYDIEPIGGALRCVGTMSDPLAHLHSRDLKSDRPGRVFDHASDSAHRRGAVAHHSTGGAEAVKDLMHETEDAIRAHLPVTIVSAKAHLPA